MLMRQLTILLLIAGLLLSAPRVVRGQSWEDTRTFPLPDDESPLWLDLEADVADVSVTGVEGIGAIEVALAIEGWSEDEIDFVADYADAHLVVRVTVIAEEQNAFGGKRSIKLALRVPAELELSMSVNVGSVTISDITVVNSLDVRTDVGAITAQAALGEGDHTLQANVGDVHFNGSLEKGALSMVSSVGDLAFTGQIGPDGALDLGAEVGAVTVTVAPGSAFRLEAQSNLGKVVDDLALHERTTQSGLLDALVQGVYGAPGQPQATVRAHTDVGEITITEAGR